MDTGLLQLLAPAAENNDRKLLEQTVQSLHESALEYHGTLPPPEAIASLNVHIAALWTNDKPLEFAFSTVPYVTLEGEALAVHHEDNPEAGLLKARTKYARDMVAAIDSGSVVKLEEAMNTMLYAEPGQATGPAVEPVKALWAEAGFTTKLDISLLEPSEGYELGIFEVREYE